MCVCVFSVSFLLKTDGGNTVLCKEAGEVQGKARPAVHGSFQCFKVSLGFPEELVHKLGTQLFPL